MLNRFVPTNLIEQLRQPRGIVVSGAVLILISLLANSAGLAIFISALVVPAAVLVDLKRRNLFDVEPWWAIAAMASAGAVAALFLTLLNVLLLKQFEDESDPFNQCCGVFMGRVNLDIPNPGGLSVVAVGVVLPILAAFLTAAGPLYLKQQPRFSDEVMDGVTLGAAAGGGYAAAAAILYFWPLVNDSPGLGGSVSGWTSALIALLIVRPLIYCAAASLICAGIWHYGIRQEPGAIIIPIGSALTGSVVLAVGSLMLADRSTLVEMLWNIALMVALLAASRFVLRQAIGQDRRSVREERRALSTPLDRIVCPECGALTRPGAFCGNCGAPLKPSGQPTEPIPVPHIIDVPTLEPTNTMSSDSHRSTVGTTTAEPDQRVGTAFPMGEPESPFGSTTTTAPTGSTSDLTEASKDSTEDQDQSAQAQHQFQSRN